MFSLLFFVMKYIVRLFLLFIIFSKTIYFSYAKTNMENVMNPSNIWWTYTRTTDYYNSNVDEFMSKWIEKTASMYGTDVATIKKILEGNLTKCYLIFDKLGIKKVGWKYSYQDFLNCSKTIEENVNNYVDSEVSNLSVEDETKWENVLADGDTSNGPYDLLADTKTISKILFKKAITIKTKFEDSNSNWNKANDGWNRNWESNGWEDNWNNPSNWWSQNNGWNDNWNSNWNNNENGWNNWWNNNNWNNPSNWWNQNNGQVDKNVSNSDFQVWNICGTNINNWWNENGWNTWNNSWNEWWGNGNNFSGFDTFDEWTPIKWWFINVGSYDGWNGLVGFKYKTWDVLWTLSDPFAGGWEWYCPPEKYILAICIKLVPSWPRWPVWGNKRVRSIEEIFDNLWDTLKDMRFVKFITLAWHGDEALDIDYKHVNLPDHFVFNIILSPKPVWNFKKNKEIEEQKNMADTNYEEVPRKLAKLYYDVGIWDPFNKENEKNKYLLTNTDYVKPEQRVKSNYNEKTDDNSAKWTSTEIKRYEEFLSNLSTTMDQLDKAMEELQGSAKNLEQKSE